MSETAPILAVDGFEGPLDWIVAMARTQRIDLASLSIVALMEAFATTLEAALRQRPHSRAPDLARWAVWTVMAADLAQLRSRLCLPHDFPGAEAACAAAEALRRQWMRRAETTAAADWLQRRPALGHDVFARGLPAVAHPPEATYDDDMPVAGGDITDLLRACLVALALPPDIGIYRPAVSLLWSVSAATDRMIALLAARPEGADLTTFLPPIARTPNRPLQARAALAATMRAALELSRSGVVTLHQAAPWQTITVHPKGITLQESI